MGTTPILKLRYPEQGDGADGPAAFNNLATDVESYVYNRVLPAGVTRSPSYYWGVASAFPSSGVVAGDTLFHSGLTCLMGYDGVNWRQRERAEVANNAGLIAISTSYSAVLYPGFEV